MSPFSSLIDSFQLRAQWRGHSSGSALKSEWALCSAARRTAGGPEQIQTGYCLGEFGPSVGGVAVCVWQWRRVVREWLSTYRGFVTSYLHSPGGAVDREVEGTAETTGSTQRHGVTFRITAKLTTKLRNVYLHTYLPPWNRFLLDKLTVP